MNFDRNKIDWVELERYGLTKEAFGQSKVFNIMLSTGKSPNLYPVTIEGEDGNYLQGFPQLHFERRPNGKIGIELHFIQELSETFEKPFYGYSFSTKEQDELIRTGNLGKVVDLTHPYNGSVYPCFVSLNPVTNELVAMEAKHLRIPDEINEIKLDELQKKNLKNGEIIRVEGMKNDDGHLFSGMAQVNANLLGVEIISDYDVRLRNDKKIKIPTHYAGEQIPSPWRKELSEGKTIRMKGMKENNYTYIQMNFHTGQAEYSKGVSENNSLKPIKQKRVSNFKL